MNESILVVKTEKLNDIITHMQFTPSISFDDYELIIKQHMTFINRTSAETDITYKQIIPYFVFTHNNKYFLMQRRANASEKRLCNKYSLGIGGHLRQEDITGSSIFDWGYREFLEEVSYKGSFNATPLGIVNDDSTPVGRVHIGFVYLINADSSEIAIKSELKSGILASIEEITAMYDSLESWSQLVFTFLNQQQLVQSSQQQMSI